LLNASINYFENKEPFMTNGRSGRLGGFTLIELLVVVLIIGILASVALPQYQKAVEKSRATQALTLLKAIAQSAETYYMANGTYATKFDELDVEIPWTGTTKGYTGLAGTDVVSNNDWSVQLYNLSNQHAIYVTRLTGAYKGASFMWFFVGDNHYGTYPLEQIICFERVDDGVVFTKNRGDYCQKILRGTPIAANSPMFTIPF
jgi:prepilin-type N-terminal cleavage/methylation domain-containing protein